MQFSTILVAASLLFTPLVLAREEPELPGPGTVITVESGEGDLPEDYYVPFDKCTELGTPRPIDGVFLIDECTIYSESGCGGQSMTFGRGYHQFKREFVAGSALCPLPSWLQPLPNFGN
ncbi:hypothetical protein FQN54_006526 [Arachnomyces sp. PD_36]|nr:hypothetical protein FQN54_006526 [Arachnomyces sp. PD_36]